MRALGGAAVDAADAREALLAAVGDCDRERVRRRALLGASLLVASPRRLWRAAARRRRVDGILSNLNLFVWVRFQFVFNSRIRCFFFFFFFFFQTVYCKGLKIA